ncbi:MAG: nucleoside phosphorylase [Nitrososphaeria archaeon]
MFRKLGKTLQPHLRVGKGDVAPYVLLPGDPKRVSLMCELLDDYRQVADYRQYITVTGTYQGIPVSVTSTGIGCPAVAIAVEELCSVGAGVLIRVGTTGAIQPNIKRTDIVIPVAAARYDGTSINYAPLQFPAVADWSVLNALVTNARRSGARFHVGVVWTSDAFYAEGRQLLEKLAELNVKSVEMECSTLFTLSSLRSSKSGAVLSVDGNLVLGTKKSAQPSTQKPTEFSREMVRSIRESTRIALNAVTELAEEE